MIKAKIYLVIMLIVLLYNQSDATYHKIGHCDGPYWSRNLALVGSTILVPDELGLHVIDVSLPENPEYVSCFNTAENCVNFEVSGNIAYIANSSNGLLILDVSNPQSPQFLSSYDTPDCALDLSISNSLAYIADRDAGLQIIDICNPSNPQFVGSYSSIHASKTEVCDSLVFVTNYYGDLFVIDVSEPEFPVLANGIGNIPEVDDICIIDSLAYVTNNNKFYIYDFSNHSTFDLISSIEVSSGTITISQDKALLTCGYAGFKILDISNISEPELIGTIQTPRCVSNTFISDEIAYITDLYTGLEIYSIDNPENPCLIGSVDETYYATSIDVEDDIAYVTDFSSYIQIHDISNPLSPSLINSYGIFYDVVDFLIEGDTGFAITDNKFYIFSLDNLIYPEIISFVNLGSTINSVHYSNSLVYVTSLFDGIKIINVENLQNPFLMGECDLPGRTYDLSISGDILYVANNTLGLQIIDVSDPNNPFIISYLSTTNTPSNVSSLTKHDNILYLASNSEGLSVVDITNPTNPIYLQNITNHSDSRFVTDPIVINEQLIIEDRNWNEILTFDISNPTTPLLTNTYTWNLSIKDWFYYDELLVTANGYNGISILNYQNITQINETNIEPISNQISNYPNPFNPTTTIAFSLSEDSAVDVCIYNVKGQQIKELLHEELSSGEHTITWNGTDAENKLVSSGVYLYKVTTGNQECVKRMLLLK